MRFEGLGSAVSNLKRRLRRLGAGAVALIAAVLLPFNAWAWAALPRIIAVDPGHGGSDPGAIGPTGLKEKVPNLAIALHLRQLLEAEGVKVVMTRDGDYDVSLSDRVTKARGAGAELFVSIHNNAFGDPGPNGTETYYYNNKVGGAPGSPYVATSQAIASYVQKAVVSSISRFDRGVHSANFYVLRQSPMPAVLIEGVFISNPEEESLLKDVYFQQRLAQGIFNGLRAYYSAHEQGPGGLVVPTVRLPWGARGEEVNRLQECLRALGVDLEVNGAYDAPTEIAVARLQKAMGLDVDGCYGPATASALRQALEQGLKLPVTSIQGSARRFTDIDGYWAEHFISVLGYIGVIHGYANGQFQPGQLVTRAQAAKMIVMATEAARKEGQELRVFLTPNAQAASKFADLQGQDMAWARPYVGAAAEAGVVMGYSETSFHPNEPLTRAQLAAMVSRLLPETGTVVPRAPFSDTRYSWARADIDRAYQAGIVSGYGDGTFGPDRYITRAELAKILYQLIYSRL